jgi:hypothetical protein
VGGGTAALGPPFLLIGGIPFRKEGGGEEMATKELFVEEVVEEEGCLRLPMIGVSAGERRGEVALGHADDDGTRPDVWLRRAGPGFRGMAVDCKRVARRQALRDRVGH